MNVRAVHSMDAYFTRLCRHDTRRLVHRDVLAASPKEIESDVDVLFCVYDEFEVDKRKRDTFFKSQSQGQDCPQASQASRPG
jgi:hypothetical protein